MIPFGKGLKTAEEVLIIALYTIYFAKECENTDYFQFEFSLSE